MFNANISLSPETAVGIWIGSVIGKTMIVPSMIDSVSITPSSRLIAMAGSGMFRLWRPAGITLGVRGAAGVEGRLARGIHGVDAAISGIGRRVERQPACGRLLWPTMKPATRVRALSGSRTRLPGRSGPQ